MATSAAKVPAAASVVAVAQIPPAMAGGSAPGEGGGATAARETAATGRLGLRWAVGRASELCGLAAGLRRRAEAAAGDEEERQRLRSETERVRAEAGEVVRALKVGDGCICDDYASDDCIGDAW